MTKNKRRLEKNHKDFLKWFEANKDLPEVDAHQYCHNNKDELLKSKKCGCFYCIKIFTPDRIKKKQWVDMSKTALCPFCGIDSVIGDTSGFPITEEFLFKMQDTWFSIQIGRAHV